MIDKLETSSFAKEQGNIENFLKSNISSSSDQPIKDYYHVDVVCDAYSKGEHNGKEKGASELIESLTDKLFAKTYQVYLVSLNVVHHLKKIDSSYQCQKMYFRYGIENSRVILSFKEELLLNDDFVKFAYTEIHKMKKMYRKQFLATLDLSLIGSDDIDEESLIEDGFGYIEEMNNE